MIDVNKLRELTKIANDKKIEEARLEAERKRLEKEAQLKAEIARAESIIANVQYLTEDAARRGYSFVTIMELKYEDYESRVNGKYVNLERDAPAPLKNTAKMVWDYLKENGLNPAIDYWHDGVGINGGYNIIAKW